MTITKELLDRLEINTFSYKIDSESSDIICNLLQQKNNTWIFQTSNYIHDIQIEKIFIKINCNAHKIEFSSDVKDKGKDYFVIDIPAVNDNIKLKTIIEELRKYELQDENYGRRKELRITIGKTNAKTFGLKTLEQKMFLNGIKDVQSCSIIDASIHGIQIITNYNMLIHNIENFKIKIDFTEPEESIIISAHKIHTRLKEIENKTYAYISCQLLEPIQFVWKNRIINIIEIVTK